MSMNYHAIVCKLEEVKDHSNADNLKIALASNYSVIVRDLEAGDLGILIPSGAQVGKEFGLTLGLFRKHPDTGEKLSGYLDPNGRVTTLKLRGELSEGLFISEKQLRDSNISLFGLSVGDQIDSLPGYEKFVSKYETSAQLRIKEKNASEKVRPKIEGFNEHYETNQFRLHNLRLSKLSGHLWITEKVHGTSGRTGKVLVSQPQNWFVRAWNRIVPSFLSISPDKKYEIVSGTRRTVMKTEYPSNSYRRQIHDYFAPLLREGEVIYYEIAGFTESGASIMGSHSTGKLDKALGKEQAKEVKAQYGNRIVYSYGCSPDGVLLSDWSLENSKKTPRFRVFIYRITRNDKELTMMEVVDRTNQLIRKGFVEYVPILETRWVDGGEKDAKEFLEEVNTWTRGPSSLDIKHPREGVCVRIDEATVAGTAFKHKGYLFCTCEGIAANDKDFVDLEDVS